MPFLGMRGTGDWANNQRPENWREAILFLFPNGSAPITAILSMMRSESTDDPHFHWFTKALAKQRAALTDDGVYTNSGLSTAYTSGGTAGDTLYLKGAEEEIKEFRIGHQILIRKDTDHRVDTVAEVTARTLAGANSFLTVALRQDADATNDIDEANSILVIGNSNAEGATMPDAISYDPQEFSNYTQIFRTPLEITRTARKTRLRTGDAYAELKREALELHSIELEKGFLRSVKTLTTGTNGKPKRTGEGIIKFIKDNAADNVDAYHLNPSYSGQAWVAGGEAWFDEMLEKIFRYGKTDKLGIAGSGALLGLNKLAKTGGQINLSPETTDFGLQVIRWLTPFGSVFVKLAPLFSQEAADRNSIVIFEPEKTLYRYIDDTMFISDPEDTINRNNSKDATSEEYLTEAHLEFHHPLHAGYLQGVGIDNALT